MNAPGLTGVETSAKVENAGARSIGPRDDPNKLAERAPMVQPTFAWVSDWIQGMSPSG